MGGYTKVSKNWADSYSDTHPTLGTGSTREKISGQVQQSEFGFGGYFQLTPNLDFYGDLTGIRLDGKLTAKATFTPDSGLGSATDKASAKDHIYGGKLMAGLRIKPASFVELWGRAGYIRLTEESGLLKRSSVVLNAGAQLQITPNFGLVGEVERYKKLNLYRAGLRASF